MINEKIGNILLLIIVGIVIIFSDNYSIIPGIPVNIKEYKYVISFLLFGLALYLLFYKDKAD